MYSNEKELLEELYTDYKDVLVKKAIHYNIPLESAEDMAQETLLRFASGKYSLNLSMKVQRAILNKILKNCCIDYFRKNKLYTIQEPSSEILPVWQPDPQDVVLGKEITKIILTEINKMSEIHREMCYMKCVLGLSDDEICQKLHISKKACYTRIARIQKRVREILKKYR